MTDYIGAIDSPPRAMPPEADIAQLQLGMVHYQLKDMGSAPKDLDAVVQTYPKSAKLPEALFYKAKALEALQNKAELRRRVHGAAPSLPAQRLRASAPPRGSPETPVPGVQDPAPQLTPFRRSRSAPCLPNRRAPRDVMSNSISYVKKLSTDFRCLPELPT